MYVLTRRTRACFKKNSSLHIWPKNFSTTFFRILPQQFYILSLKNSDDLFLVIALFYDVHPFTSPSFLFLHFFRVKIFERPFLTLNPTISHFISQKFC